MTTPDFKLRSITLATPYDEVDLRPFLDQGENPFERGASLQRTISANGFEFTGFDAEFTKTGATATLTAQGMKAAKIITKDNEDDTLFTREESIYATFSYFHGNDVRQETSVFNPKKAFNNKPPTANELFAAFCNDIKKIVRTKKLSDAVKRALVRGAGVTCARALMFSESADMKMVTNFYASLPLYKVAAEEDLEGIRVIDSHCGDAYLTIAIFADEVLQALKGDMRNIADIESNCPVLSTGAASNNHGHEVRRVMAILVSRLGLSDFLVEQDYVLIGGRRVRQHGKFYVVKQLVDPNKITSILMAALTLVQYRDNALVLSGECRAKLLLKDLRSVLGVYSYTDLLEVGYFPLVHFRLVAPLVNVLDKNQYLTGLCGTLATNPNIRPKRPTQPALAKFCPSGFLELCIGNYIGAQNNWDFQDRGLNGLDLHDIPTPEYHAQCTNHKYVPRRLLNISSAEVQARYHELCGEELTVPHQLSEDATGLYKIAAAAWFYN